MKRSFILALAATLALATPAFAETSIGVVNIQKIMRESKAANSVRAQLNEKQKSFQAEYDSKAKAIYAEDQALVKQSGTVTDKAAFEQKVKDFRSKADTVEKEIQTKKMQLNKGFNSALEQIQQNVITIVKEIAAEKKLTLVVGSGQVLYADNSLDITNEVQQRLDAKLPNVKISF